MENTAYILLGTNLGDRVKYLNLAKTEITRKDILVVGSSSIYSTKPWGVEDQPDFLNQVLKIQTTFSPRELLTELLEIEKTAGRTRENKWGPRTLDIDILFYNEDIVDLPDLTIPHPQLHLRRFTLEPLNEIAPDLIHPGLKLSINKLLDVCPDENQASIADTSASL